MSHQHTSRVSQEGESDALFVVFQARAVLLFIGKLIKYHTSFAHVSQHVALPTLPCSSISVGHKYSQRNPATRPSPYVHCDMTSNICDHALCERWRMLARVVTNCAQHSHVNLAGSATESPLTSVCHAAYNASRNSFVAYWPRTRVRETHLR